jgi:hypothetical protein
MVATMALVHEWSQAFNLRAWPSTHPPSQIHACLDGHSIREFAAQGAWEVAVQDVPEHCIRGGVTVGTGWPPVELHGKHQGVEVQQDSDLDSRYVSCHQWSCMAANRMHIIHQISTQTA